MWGDRQDILIEGSNEAWGSDANFLRTRLNSQWVRSLGENNRFVGRATVGATSTDDFRQVPPSLRFFTGGDSSVRGYEYETIAPENSSGELLGGKHLLVGSLEYQRRVANNWWGATFVDTGNAFNDWWPDELKTSAGVGVRWISPVGPVRLDIAHPFDSEVLASAPSACLSRYPLDSGDASRICPDRGRRCPFAMGHLQTA